MTLTPTPDLTPTLSLTPNPTLTVTADPLTPDLAQPGYAQPGAAPPAGQHHCSAAYALASLPAQSAKPREPKAAMATRTPKAP